jgi:hypothetical protein
MKTQNSYNVGDRVRIQVPGNSTVYRGTVARIVQQDGRAGGVFEIALTDGNRFEDGADLVAGDWMTREPEVPACYPVTRNLVERFRSEFAYHASDSNLPSGERRAHLLGFLSGLAISAMAAAETEDFRIADPQLCREVFNDLGEMYDPSRNPFLPRPARDEQLLGELRRIALASTPTGRLCDERA